MKTGPALNRAAARLPIRRNLPDPQREALFLLAAAWGRNEIGIRIHPEEELPPDVESRFSGWVERRAAGEPTEYIVGSCRFWGRSFRVTPAVLIPRPETELIVEHALAIVAEDTCDVLDVGTGSGCLAITLALERPRWRVVATDRSPAALGIARTNGETFGVDILWILTDLAAALPGPFDLIVANLPYVPTGWLADLGPEIDREPRTALDGGEDGLDLVRRLIADLRRILVPGGNALLEIAEGQAEAVETAVISAGLQPVERLRDVGGCERVVHLRRPLSPCPGD